MRFMVRASMPHEPFNTMVREGTAGQHIGRILEETKPEAVYFTEENGQRCAVAVYNIEKLSQVPSLTEPFFLTFNADCHVQIAMTPDDLKQAKLDDLGKRWRK
jgi:hypothetical protein